MLAAIILGCIISGPIEAAVPEAGITVSTNFAYDLVGGVNLGAEYPISEKFSARADCLFPWFVWNSNQNALQLLHVELGGRYYLSPSKPMSGIYLNVAAGAGYYDLESKGKGYQGEELLLQFGCGYARKLKGPWSIDLGLGLGPVISKYRRYEVNGKSNDLIYRNDGRFFYFGPTTIRASISYTIYCKRR